MVAVGGCRWPWYVLRPIRISIALGHFGLPGSAQRRRRLSVARHGPSRSENHRCRLRLRLAAGLRSVDAARSRAQRRIGGCRVAGLGGRDDCTGVSGVRHAGGARGGDGWSSGATLRGETSTNSRILVARPRTRRSIEIRRPQRHVDTRSTTVPALRRSVAADPTFQASS